MVTHIQRARLIGWEIRHFKCPNCEKRRFLSEYYSWYAPNHACLNCGDEYSYEGRKQRPFMRGWREKAIEKHNKRLAFLEENSPELKGELLLDED